ncbi:MAG: hypothetical protein CEO12_84 [Parcubacteria group bacterium Gr01-1014_46]|nr:MAG: hypothetical protein CEO12_84 [Parcubacteria group bacterium Gr01-1014_46]
MADSVPTMLARFKKLLVEQYFSKPVHKRPAFEAMKSQVVREAGYQSGADFTDALKALSEAHAKDRKERREKFAHTGSDR